LCHVLVVCCLMMVSRTAESMIRGYHEYITKLSLESELDLLKYCNMDILTSILTENKLKCTSHCCACLMLQKMKEVANCCDSSNLPKFFYCTVLYMLSWEFSRNSNNSPNIMFFCSTSYCSYYNQLASGTCVWTDYTPKH